MRNRAPSAGTNSLTGQGDKAGVGLRLLSAVLHRSSTSAATLLPGPGELRGPIKALAPGTERGNISRLPPGRRYGARYGELTADRPPGDRLSPCPGALPSLPGAAVTRTALAADLPRRPSRGAGPCPPPGASLAGRQGPAGPQLPVPTRPVGGPPPPPPPPPPAGRAAAPPAGDPAPARPCRAPWRPLRDTPAPRCCGRGEGGPLPAPGPHGPPPAPRQHTPVTGAPQENACRRPPPPQLLREGDTELPFLSPNLPLPAPATPRASPAQPPHPG